MAGYNALNLSFEADGAVSRGDVLYISGDNKVKATTGALGTVIGVAAVDAADGELVTVQADGIAKVVASGAIAAGAIVVSAASGRVATVASNTFDKVLGKALQEATTAGDVIEILLG